MLSEYAAKEGDEVIEDKIKWKVIATNVVKKINDDKNGLWYDKFKLPEQDSYTKVEKKEDPTKKHRRISTSTSFINSLERLIKYMDEFIWYDQSIDEKTHTLIEILDAY